ncbi:MAG TPA: class I SAM-dependent methyltransferase [Candidatus Angelobacter sp.]|jgi:SAM-dependent methyltransferase|nr:class I SAM-dependent methyltransferase [Candidatus Angelobacter sp.]
MTTNAEIERQALHHSQLFTHLSHWDEVWKAAMEVVGDRDIAVGLGLDQLGLLGPRGVSLALDRLIANANGQELRCVLELGSGFGGALRHAEQNLKSRGIHPLLIGVEIVWQHCQVAKMIGQAMGDVGPAIVQGDVGCLPIRSASIDAVFAAGSASHFRSVGDVARESHRVLRPGGVFVMIDEVSLRPAGAPPLSEDFLVYHPYFQMATPEERRSQIESAGLTIVAFESLAAWGAALLRQRAEAMRFLGACAQQVYGAEESESIIATLKSAAHEFGSGGIQPTLIVARRLSES